MDGTKFFPFSTWRVRVRVRVHKRVTVYLHVPWCAGEYVWPGEFCGQG